MKKSWGSNVQIDARFVDLLALYRAELLERVVPFWLDNAVDWGNGGILTCISDEGRVLSEDKYMWSQLRAIWTFSALFNKIEPRSEWLDVARHIVAGRGPAHFRLRTATRAR
jgi:N-acylglucosamine 2-epimerase